MDIYVDLNLATFQCIDGFGCYNFCLKRFGLELMILLLNFSATFGTADYCNLRFSFRTAGYCRTAS